MDIDLASLELISMTTSSKIDLSGCPLIGFYFSAHWCPPSRLFTPKLISLYNVLNSASKKLEIVYVSFDRDINSCEAYFEEMPWVAIPYNNSETRLKLAKIFKVANPFCLVILTSAGQPITTKGIEDLKSMGAQAYDFWYGFSDQVSRFSSPPFCQKGHLMDCVAAAEKSPCGCCKTEIISGWKCTECNLTLCQMCEEWVCTSSLCESPDLICLNSHSLRMTSGLDDYYLKRFLSAKYTCRTCNDYPDGQGYHCRSCFFDVCTKCSKRISNISSMDKGFCNNQHGINWVPDLCTKLMEKFKVCKFRCEDCEESFTGGGAYACIECEYYICVCCLAKTLLSEVISDPINK
jgi:thiol-disulfide isomerase/thioredoxin